jgi:steroid delta-isomerase-like uncharacterized protein
MKKSMRKGSVLALSGLILCLCFSIACQDKAAMAELEKFRAQATVEQQNMALVTEVFNELNKKNTEVYKKLYAPDYGWHFPSNNPKGLTREEEEGFSKMLWAGFPDMRYDIKEMVARADKVMVRFVTRGTHTGEYQGLPPTGKKVEASGMWLGQVTDGKIVNSKEDFDVLGWMQQLGMELRPKEAKKK